MWGLLFSDLPVCPQVKCEHYWPLDAKTCTHGHLQVTLKGEEVLENWTVRDLMLQHVSPWYSASPILTIISSPGFCASEPLPNPSPLSLSQGTTVCPGMPSTSQIPAHPLHPLCPLPPTALCTPSPSASLPGHVL